MREINYFYHDFGAYIDISTVTRLVSSNTPARAVIDALPKGPTVRVCEAQTDVGNQCRAKRKVRSVRLMSMFTSIARSRFCGCKLQPQVGHWVLRSQIVTSKNQL